jgi:hypothetical protein
MLRHEFRVPECPLRAKFCGIADRPVLADSRYSLQNSKVSGAFACVRRFRINPPFFGIDKRHQAPFGSE